MPSITLISNSRLIKTEKGLKIRAPLLTFGLYFFKGSFMLPESAGLGGFEPESSPPPQLGSSVGQLSAWVSGLFFDDILPPILF